MTTTHNTDPARAAADDPTAERLSRRALLGAGAGAVVLAACADDGPNVALEGEIVSVRVPGVPLDPEAARWDEAPVTVVELEGQTTAMPYRARPAVPSIRVRSLHDDAVVAFRVDWDDPEAHDETVGVDSFRDACAVLLGAPGLGDDIRFMGTQEQPTTLLHWKADWQRDVDEGITTIDHQFPNRSVDAYPPLVTSTPHEVTALDYVDAGATQWLPGMHVGNVLSAPVRTSPVEKTIAWGFRTTASAPSQDATGRGVHHAGGWSAVLAKPRRAADPGELSVTSQGATCAFAVWSGADGDAGGRKSPSARTYRLVLRDRSFTSPLAPRSGP